MKKSLNTLIYNYGGIEKWDECRKLQIITESSKH